MYRWSTLAGVSLLVWISGGPVQAQDNPQVVIPQMNVTDPAQADATGASQILPLSPASANMASSQHRDRRIESSDAPPPEFVPYLQLNQEQSSAEAGPQLAPESSGAGPSPSPAARAQGRVTAVVAPKGRDRCDPSASGTLPEGCERVIEARARDFTVPDPQPLSAE